MNSTLLGMINDRIKRGDRPKWGDVLSMKIHGKPMYYRDPKTDAIRSVRRDAIRILRREAAKARKASAAEAAAKKASR